MCHGNLALVLSLILMTEMIVTINIILLNDTHKKKSA